MSRKDNSPTPPRSVEIVTTLTPQKIGVIKTTDNTVKSIATNTLSTSPDHFFSNAKNQNSPPIAPYVQVATDNDSPSNLMSNFGNRSFRYNYSQSHLNLQSLDRDGDSPPIAPPITANKQIGRIGHNSFRFQALNPQSTSTGHDDLPTSPLSPSKKNNHRQASISELKPLANDSFYSNITSYSPSTPSKFTPCQTSSPSYSQNSSTTSTPLKPPLGKNNHSAFDAIYLEMNNLFFLLPQDCKQTIGIPPRPNIENHQPIGKTPSKKLFSALNRNDDDDDYGSDSLHTHNTSLTSHTLTAPIKNESEPDQEKTRYEHLFDHIVQQKTFHEFKHHSQIQKAFKNLNTKARELSKKIHSIENTQKEALDKYRDYLNKYPKKIILHLDPAQIETILKALSAVNCDDQQTIQIIENIKQKTALEAAQIELTLKEFDQFIKLFTSNNNQDLSDSSLHAKSILDTALFNSALIESNVLIEQSLAKTKAKSKTDAKNQASPQTPEEDAKERLTGAFTKATKKYKLACENQDNLQTLQNITNWINQVVIYYNVYAQKMGITTDMLKANLYVQSDTPLSQDGNKTQTAKACAIEFFAKLFEDPDHQTACKLADNAKARRINENIAEKNTGERVISDDKKQPEDKPIEPSCISFFTATLNGTEFCFVAPSSLSSKESDLGFEAAEVFRALKATQRQLNKNPNRDNKIRYIVLDIQNIEFNSLFEKLLTYQSDDAQNQKYPHLKKSSERNPDKCCAEKRLSTVVAKMFYLYGPNFHLLDSINCNLTFKELTASSTNTATTAQAMTQPKSDTNNLSESEKVITYLMPNDVKGYTETKSCCANCMTNQPAIYMLWKTMLEMHASKPENYNEVASEITPKGLAVDLQIANQQAAPISSISNIFESPITPPKREMTEESCQALNSAANKLPTPPKLPF